MNTMVAHKGIDLLTVKTIVHFFAFAPKFRFIIIN